MNSAARFADISAAKIDGFWQPGNPAFAKGLKRPLGRREFFLELTV
jgi:hypothetical protein